MISSVANYARTACSDLYSKAPTANQMLKNVTKVALPAIALAAMSNLSAAEAGPLTYSICVGGCIAINPLWTAICPVICMPAFFSPSP